MRGKLENCFCLKSEKQPGAEVVAAKSLTKIRLQHQLRRESRAPLIAGINLRLQNIPNLFLQLWLAWPGPCQQQARALLGSIVTDVTLSLSLSLSRCGVTDILVTL